MMASEHLVSIPGSEPPPRFAATVVRPANANEFITVTVKVRSKDEKAAEDGLEKQAAVAAHARKHVGREDFAATHGADPAELKKVEDYARSKGLSVVESCAAKRRVVLAGKVSDFEGAFGVKLEQFQHPGGTFRSYSTPVHVPADLQTAVEAVLGLSNRPAAKPHFQYRKRANATAKAFTTAAPEPLTPLQVAQLYDFPTGLDGSGQCIAIIELGGGYNLDDLQTYFDGLGIEMPDVSDVSVLGGSNSPGSDADGEVMLDIEVAGAVAPKAKIVVYFAPNTTQGFVRAITDAAHDTVNKPSIISISWGGPESTWRGSDRTAMSNAIRDAGLLGVTVTVAAGDNGSADGLNAIRLMPISQPPAPTPSPAAGPAWRGPGPRSPRRPSGTTGPTAPRAAASVTASRSRATRPMPTSRSRSIQGISSGGACRISRETRTRNPGMRCGWMARTPSSAAPARSHPSGPA